MKNKKNLKGQVGSSLQRIKIKPDKNRVKALKRYKELYLLQKKKWTGERQQEMAQIAKEYNL